jgi:hypothetical protein
MAWAPEAVEFLDVQVEQISRTTPFITARRPWRLQSMLRTQPPTRQHSADRGACNSELLADETGRLPEQAQVFDEPTPFSRQGVGSAIGARGAVAKASAALLAKAPKPLVYRSPANASGGGCLTRTPPLLEDAANEQSSTGWCGPGILMDVHPGFSLLEVDRLAPISFSGLARVNNPHRNHT